MQIIILVYLVLLLILSGCMEAPKQQLEIKEKGIYNASSREEFYEWYPEKKLKIKADTNTGLEIKNASGGIITNYNEDVWADFSTVKRLAIKFCKEFNSSFLRYKQIKKYGNDIKYECITETKKKELLEEERLKKIKAQLKKEKDALDIIMTKAKNQCHEFGFKKGSEKHAECMLKIYEIEINISLIEVKKQNELSKKNNERLIKEKNLELVKQQIEMQKKRIAIEEDRANREKWNNISEGLKILSDSLYGNQNKRNDDFQRQLCINDCRVQGDNYSYCQRVCR